MSTATIDQLNEEYRTLKDERAKLLTAAKAEDGEWPADVKKAAAEADKPVTDYVADNLEPGDAARLADIDAELRRISDARRLLRKPSRQKAAEERKVAVADRVAGMTDEEREEYRKALDRHHR